MKTVFKRGAIVAASAAIVTLMSTSVSSALIVGVSGGSSTEGISAEILIGAPSAVLDDTVFNTGQQGFNEKQGVWLSGAIDTDQGQFNNMRVDSHMIFLNSEGQNNNQDPWDIGHFNVSWEFSGQILGVMADRGGSDEAGSTGQLGLDGTSYPSAFSQRGLEGNYHNSNNLNSDDFYSINGNFLTLSMYVTEPGDWIRVVTVSAVPLPAALPLYGAGIALLGFLGWRKKKAISI